MFDRSQTSTTDLLALIAHLDRAQRLSNTGSWEWDIRTNALIWSDQIYRIFGLEIQAFEPSYPAFLERIHPDDRQAVEDGVRRAIERTEDYALDHRIVLPNGRIRTVHEQGVVEFGPNGEALKMLGAVQDVTALRSAEISTLRSQSMLASLFKISPEAIIVTDPAARILLFSAGAETMFGYSAAEVIGLGVEQLMPVRARRHHQNHVRNFADGEAPSLRMHERSEILGLRKSGEEFPAEASLAKLETGDGFVFTTIVRDLSERRAAERRLVEARELAEHANLSKSSFLANMSHEIRTPLNGVLGIASALARTELNPKQSEMIHLIEISGRALERLLSDILDLAKVDAGRLQVRAEPFDLTRLVKDTFALFSASAAEKGVALRLQLDPQACGHFHGDDLRIRQVLSNLLSNAVKFTRQGEIALSVGPPVVAGDSCFIRFSVKDTGIGFGSEVAQTLFDRFEQADGSITRRFGGSGLGLAISKALVELMAGTISASSVPGQGSTFEFQLPLQRAASPAESGKTAHQPAPLAPERPMRILLAEDHAINRRTIELILETLPVDLACVDDGQAAVAVAREQAFDLILMDMQMPVMDGLTAIRHIRAHEKAAGKSPATICVLTANALPEHREFALSAGSDAFLTKPISAQSLITFVLETFAANARQPALAS